MRHTGGLFLSILVYFHSSLFVCFQVTSHSHSHSSICFRQSQTMHCTATHRKHNTPMCSLDLISSTQPTSLLVSLESSTLVYIIPRQCTLSDCLSDCLSAPNESQATGTCMITFSPMV